MRFRSFNTTYFFKSIIFLLCFKLQVTSSFQFHPKSINEKSNLQFINLDKNILSKYVSYAIIPFLSFSPCFAVENLPISESLINPITSQKTIDESPQQSIAEASQSTRKDVILPSGLKYYDYCVGDGNIADEGKTVQFQWVLRRSNGYFVDSSTNYDEPLIYKVGNLKKVIPGVDEGIRGMRVGGIRRLLIPPKLAYLEGKLKLILSYHYHIYLHIILV